MDNLFGIISKINESMSKYIVDELKKEGHKGIVSSHGAILIQFMDNETLNYRELSKKINKSPQTMTTLIRKLQDLKYVTISVSKMDKRSKLVNLTQKGKDFIPVMMEISKRLYEIQYQSLGEVEINQLRLILTTIRSNFEEINNDN